MNYPLLVNEAAGCRLRPGKFDFLRSAQAGVHASATFPLVAGLPDRDPHPYALHQGCILRPAVTGSPNKRYGPARRNILWHSQNIPNWTEKKQSQTLEVIGWQALIHASDGIYASTRAESSRILIGFDMYTSQPAERALSASPLRALAVIAIIGTDARLCFELA